MPEKKLSPSEVARKVAKTIVIPPGVHRSLKAQARRVRKGASELGTEYIKTGLAQEVAS